MLEQKQALSAKNSELLEESFFGIIEEFNKQTDNKGFDSFLSKSRYEFQEDNEMLIIALCEILMELHIGNYEDHLSRIGIEGTYEQIKLQITQLKAKYAIDRENKKGDINKQKKTDFYTMWAFAIEQIGFFPASVLLPEWCGILNILRQKADANESINGKNK